MTSDKTGKPVKAAKKQTGPTEDNPDTKKDDKKLDNTKLTRGLAAVGGLWILVFFLIDLGLINVGWQPPIGIFNRGNQVSDFVETATVDAPTGDAL